MIFTRDFVTRENLWQIASLVTQKSLFTVTHALFFISSIDWWQKYKHRGHTHIIPDFGGIFAKKLVILCPQLLFGYENTGFRIREYEYNEKNPFQSKIRPESEVSGYPVSGYARFDYILIRIPLKFIKQLRSHTWASLTPSYCPWPHRAVAADHPQWILINANNGSWAAMGALTSMLD